MPPRLSDRLRDGLFRVARTSLHGVGIDVRRHQEDHHYVLDYHGRSAHKQRDIREIPGFGALARAVIAEGRTSHYYDRLHILWQVLQNLRALGSVSDPIELVEVGVYRGGTSYFLLAAARELGLTNVRLHAFDTFEGHPHADVNAEIDTVQTGGRFADASCDEVKKYLSSFPGVSVHRGRFEETCREIETLPIHFAHVDVNLHGPTKHALEFLTRRLVPAGVIVVDDYGSLTNSGVRKAVDDLLAQTSSFLALELLTDQCLLVERGSRTRGGGA